MRTEVGDRTIAITDNVEAGARLLDERVPNWFLLINTETLHLSDMRHCVLGQLIAAGAIDDGRWEPDWDSTREQYSRALDSLGLRWDTQYGYGFSIDTTGGEDYDVFDPWEYATQAWVAEVERRVEEP